MKVALIGSGNVATVLGRKIYRAGHEIVQVFSPTEQHATMLAQMLNCAHTSSWDQIDANADLYLVAIADQPLLQIKQNLSLHNKLVVHTAGSVSKDVLKPVSTNYGVIYPLQTLRKELKEFPLINLLVDGNTQDDLTLIFDFAQTFADHVEIAGDEQRLKLHLAAVIVSNFSNHLYALAEDYCASEKINFNLLLPLIAETANRLLLGSPRQMQTGPAVRNDMHTIQKHLDILDSHPAMKHLFATLTKSIQDFYKNTDR